VNLQSTAIKATLWMGGLVLMGLGGPLAWNWYRIQRADSALQAEFAELAVSGLWPEKAPAESEGLAAARMELERLLAAVEPQDSNLGGFAFGAPWMMDDAGEEGVARLAAGLKERSQLLADIEALPDVLWHAWGEPPQAPNYVPPAGWRRRPTDSMLALRSMTNLLCAQAWYVAREPEGGAEAGRWLARALAVARVTDSGESFDLKLRLLPESIALDRFEQLRAEGIVDVEALSAPVLAELARGDGCDRLRLGLSHDLVLLEKNYRAGLSALAEPVTGRQRAPALEGLLVAVLFTREMLEGGLEIRRAEPTELRAQRATPSHELSMHSLVECQDLRDERRSRLLAGG
jgi:hypothetical protein